MYWHIEPPRNPPAFIVLVWDSRHLGSKLKPGGSYWEDNPTAHKENQKTKKHWNSLPRLNSSCIPCGLGPQVQPWDFLQSCFPHIRILNKANLVTSCSGVFMRRLFSLGDHASCTEWSAMSASSTNKHSSQVIGIVVWTWGRSIMFFLLHLLVWKTELNKISSFFHEGGLVSDTCLNELFIQMRNYMKPTWESESATASIILNIFRTSAKQNEKLLNLKCQQSKECSGGSKKRKWWECISRHLQVYWCQKIFKHWSEGFHFEQVKLSELACLPLWDKKRNL